MKRNYLLALVFVLLSVNVSTVLADDDVNGVIVQFNGAKVMGVEANTGNKDFRPFFEKELANLSGDLPGKPELKITQWYTIINGAAVKVTKGPADTAKKLMDALKKQLYVKTVELDQKASVAAPK